MEVAYFNYIDSIELPLDVVKACSHRGNCEDDVIRCMELPEVKNQLDLIDKDQLIKELREYGAWDNEQLQDHKENLSRILWIAAGNISDDL